MVRVDDAIYSWRGRLWCHLTADTVEELHDFAKDLGLKRSWFQDHAVPHYDITASKRVEALQLGAVYVSAHDQARARIAARRERKGLPT